MEDDVLKEGEMAWNLLFYGQWCGYYVFVIQTTSSIFSVFFRESACDFHSFIADILLPQKQIKL